MPIEEIADWRVTNISYAFRVISRRSDIKIVRIINFSIQKIRKHNINNVTNLHLYQ